MGWRELWYCFVDLLVGRIDSVAVGHEYSLVVGDTRNVERLDGSELTWLIVCLPRLQELYIPVVDYVHISAHRRHQLD